MLKIENKALSALANTTLLVGAYVAIVYVIWYFVILKLVANFGTLEAARIAFSMDNTFDEVLKSVVIMHFAFALTKLGKAKEQQNERF
jgi:hypothetical protein